MYETSRRPHGSIVAMCHLRSCVEGDFTVAAGCDFDIPMLEHGISVLPHLGKPLTLDADSQESDVVPHIGSSFLALIMICQTSFVSRSANG